MSGEVRLKQLEQFILDGPTQTNGQCFSVETLLDILICLYDECNNSPLRREKNILEYLEWGELFGIYVMYIRPCSYLLCYLCVRGDCVELGVLLGGIIVCAAFERGGAKKKPILVIYLWVMLFSFFNLNQILVYEVYFCAYRPNFVCWALCPKASGNVEECKINPLIPGEKIDTQPSDLCLQSQLYCFKIESVNQRENPSALLKGNAWSVCENGEKYILSYDGIAGLITWSWKVEWNWSSPSPIPFSCLILEEYYSGCRALNENKWITVLPQLSQNWFLLFFFLIHFPPPKYRWKTEDASDTRALMLMLTVCDLQSSKSCCT